MFYQTTTAKLPSKIWDKGLIFLFLPYLLDNDFSDISNNNLKLNVNI